MTAVGGSTPHATRPNPCHTRSSMSGILCQACDLALAEWVAALASAAQPTRGCNPKLISELGDHASIAHADPVRPGPAMRYALFALLPVLGSATSALALDPAAPPTPTAAHSAPHGGASAAELTGEVETAPASFVLGGWATAYGQWNFNRPVNGITHARGFDNRHASLTLSEVAFDAQWVDQGLSGRITLQAGPASATYYASEPNLPGAAYANGSDAELWRWIQQAHVGYRAASLRDLQVQAGLFLSPIGPEGMAVRDNWNLSRANAFFGLPFYHTGARANLPLNSEWTATVAAYNGWNSVVDRDVGKALNAQLTWARPGVGGLSLLYFGCNERAVDSAEGQAWRHVFDAHLTWVATPRLSVLAHLDAGWETHNFGRHAWQAAALYGRYQLSDLLFVAVRADGLREAVPNGASGIFFATGAGPVPWVGSATATLDLRPHHRVSIKLEGRHDRAGAPLYFGRDTLGDGVKTSFVADRRAQTTLTVAMTSWF